MKKYQLAIIRTDIGAKHFEDFQKVSNFQLPMIILYTVLGYQDNQ